MIDVNSLAIETFIQSIPTMLMIATGYFIVKGLMISYLKSKEYSKDNYRKDLELEIAKLNARMTMTQERFESVNHLVIGGNKKVVKYGADDFLGKMGVSKDIDVKSKTVFVLTPFNEEYNKDYQWVEEAFSKHKYICTRGDDVKVQNNLLSHIIKEMLSSKFVVANISGRNPNVFYELGIAHALGKDVILISRSEKDITFDLSSSQIIIYKEREDLHSSINAWLVSLLESKLER
ncbi:hypothetical protein SJR98_19845 [Aeromonas hydrophila]|uniref:hypothetical protein n=1 Tax=Aeromonas hydrophila TaxID=644 RepID=UPI0029D89E7C|nr:hypothetical protein [Aeromonas hydrophila]MDX7780336.1 hypothetical protein [Aeromonas hydrophila]